MALLARAAAIAGLGTLAGCYSPDLRDCTVTCATAADCAGSQVCTADHFCAMPDKASTCGPAQPDGGRALDAGAGDARPDGRPPADAAPDAPPLGALELVVMGHGQLVAGSHTCATDCTYMMPLDPIEVVAIGAADQQFDHWTIGPCVGSQSTSCTVTPPAVVGVKFRKEDH